VVYKDGREEYISNPAEFPDTTDPKMRVAHIEEPMGMYPYRQYTIVLRQGNVDAPCQLSLTI
jgi:hypothetical protein